MDAQYASVRRGQSRIKQPVPEVQEVPNQSLVSKASFPTVPKVPTVPAMSRET